MGSRQAALPPSWRYRPASGRSCCRMLAKMDFNAKEIEAIMRSKWTRWASDMSGHGYGKVNSADLRQFLEQEKNLRADVKRLVTGTL